MQNGAASSVSQTTQMTSEQQRSPIQQSVPQQTSYQQPGSPTAEELPPSSGKSGPSYPPMPE